MKHKFVKEERKEDYTVRHESILKTTPATTKINLEKKRQAHEIIKFIGNDLKYQSHSKMKVCEQNLI